MFDIREYNTFEKQNKKTRWTWSEDELHRINGETRIIGGQRLYRGKLVDNSRVGLFQKDTSTELNQSYFKFKIKKGLI